MEDESFEKIGFFTIILILAVVITAVLLLYSYKKEIVSLACYSDASFACIVKAKYFSDSEEEVIENYERACGGHGSSQGKGCYEAGLMHENKFNKSETNIKKKEHLYKAINYFELACSNSRADFKGACQKKKMLYTYLEKIAPELIIEKTPVTRQELPDEVSSTSADVPIMKEINTLYKIHGNIVKASFVTRDGDIKFDFGYGTIYDKKGGNAFLKTESGMDLYHIDIDSYQFLETGKGSVKFQMNKYEDKTGFAFNGNIEGNTISGQLIDQKDNSIRSLVLTRTDDSCPHSFIEKEYSSEGRLIECEKKGINCSATISFKYVEPEDIKISGDNFRKILIQIAKESFYNQGANDMEFNSVESAYSWAMSEAVKGSEDLVIKEKTSDTYISLQSCTDKMISLRVSKLEYLGGASTSKSVYSRTYDINTGQRLYITKEYDGEMRSYIKRSFEKDITGDLDEKYTDSFAVFSSGFVFEKNAGGTALVPGLTVFVPLSEIIMKNKGSDPAETGNGNIDFKTEYEAAVLKHNELWKRLPEETKRSMLQQQRAWIKEKESECGQDQECLYRWETDRISLIEMLLK